MSTWIWKIQELKLVQEDLKIVPATLDPRRNVVVDVRPGKSVRVQGLDQNLDLGTSGQPVEVELASYGSGKVVKSWNEKGILINAQFKKVS